MATAEAEDRGLFVLGIDGGGSKCAAVLGRLATTGDGGVHIVGRGRGGPANPRVAGHEMARASITAAIAQAFADAGLGSRPVAAACLGLAGVGLPEDRDAVLAWATQAGLADTVLVVPDGLLPFADGAAEPWGVVLIAGTGSLALALPRGETLSAATALNPFIGYDRASEIVKAAAASGRSLREVALEAGVEESVLDEALDYHKMAKPHD